jgi:TolB-like protein/DNA-binding SARP family transcriptional activator
MFTLRVFGGAVLDGPDGRVKGGAAQRRRITLLVLLARARGRPMGRDKLIGLLWPEHSTDAARHLLAQALYQVRKALPQEPFNTPGDEVALIENVLACDANTFEDAIAAGALERAVELYQGEFLDGFFLPNAAEFEHWIEKERGGLRRAREQVLERLAEAAEAANDPLRAAEWWLRAAEHEPYSSRLVLRRMRTLEWGGEHLAAIRAAERHAEFLKEDLGASPDPEVLAYAERLRTNPSPGWLAPVPAPQCAVRREPLAEAPGPERSGVDDEPDEGAPLVNPQPIAASTAPKFTAEVDAVAVAVPRRQKLAPMAAAGLILLIAAASVIWALGSPLDRSPAPPRIGNLDPRRIAVLYFEDLSEHQDAGHIAAGLTEALIHELAQVPSLDVVSRNGVKPFRGREASFDTIAKTLRSGSVVEGSVQRAGGRLRVTVQLIDGSTGTHLQSRTLVRPVGELFALEEALGKEVSRFLRERLGEEIRMGERLSGTQNPAAREAMMQAEELRRRTERAAGEPDPLGPGATIRLLVRADSLLGFAEREDPSWREPKVLRGWVALDLAQALVGQERSLNLSRGIAYAEAALARAPGDPAALELRGTARWRLARLDSARSVQQLQNLLASAEQDLKTALERDPSRATAWSTLSQYLRLQGRHPEADVSARRALETDEFLADSDLIMERLYRSALLVGRFDEAWKWCGEGRMRFPTNWRFVECELTLLGYGRGTPEEVQRAWALRRELEQLDPSTNARASSRAYSPVFRDMDVALVLARAGMRDSARAVVARARRAADGPRDLKLASPMRSATPRRRSVS